MRNKVLSQKKNHTPNPEHAKLVFLSYPVKSAWRRPAFTFREGGKMNGGSQPEQDWCISVRVSSYQCQQGQGMRGEEGPLSPDFTQMYSLLFFTWMLLLVICLGLLRGLFFLLNVILFGVSLDTEPTADLGLMYTVVPPWSAREGPSSCALSWWQLWRSLWSQESDGMGVQIKKEEGEC